MRIIAPFIVLSALAQLAMATGMLAQSTGGSAVPIYGNWCGPNYPADPTRAGPPVDPLDAACLRHDICVATRGSFDCGCDVGLLRELRATPWPNPVIQSNARAIYDAIALAPCSAPDGMALKQSMFSADLMTDMMSGQGTPMDVVDRWRRLMLGP